MLHGLQGYCAFITDDMLAAAIALAGGGARSTYGSCGAYSAGLMALSAKMSPRTPAPTKEQIAELEKSETYDKPGRAQQINRELADVQHRLAAVNPEWEQEATRLARGPFV